MTAVTTLEKILSNIIGNPMEDKYRRVKKMNAAFQKRLGGLVGGDDAMKAAGFTTKVDGGEEVYIMHASAEGWPFLLATKATVDGAVRDAKAAANMSSAPPPLMMPGMGAGAVGGGGMPNFGNLPGMGAGMGGPEMQAAAARMMQDPSAMQAMLQVSYVFCHFECTMSSHCIAKPQCKYNLLLLFLCVESNGAKYDEK